MITPNELLAEAEQTILRSDMGKLMRIARIARPDAIYDASAAAQTFPTEEMVGFLEEGVCSEDEEKENSPGWKGGKIPNTCRASPSSK